MIIMDGSLQLLGTCLVEITLPFPFSAPKNIDCFPCVSNTCIKAQRPLTKTGERARVCVGWDRMVGALENNKQDDEIREREC
jgi:hypothetical protein